MTAFSQRAVAKFRRLAEKVVPRGKGAASKRSRSGRDAGAIKEFKQTAWQSQRAVSEYRRATSHVGPGMRIEREVALRFARGQVLDVGAGTGRFSIALSHNHCKVTAVDLSAAMLSAIAEDAGRSVSVVRASGFGLPFEAEQFDSAISFWLLLHFEDWLQILAEMIRVTRPGGLIIFEVQNRLNLDKASEIAPGADFLGRLRTTRGFQAFEDSVHVAAIAKELETKVVWSRYYELLSDNFIAQATLGSRYSAWAEEMQCLLKNRQCLEFWWQFENKYLTKLPGFLARKQLFVLQKSPTDLLSIKALREEQRPNSAFPILARNLTRSIDLFLEAFEEVCPQLRQLFSNQCMNN